MPRESKDKLQTLNTECFPVVLFPFAFKSYLVTIRGHASEDRLQGISFHMCTCLVPEVLNSPILLFDRIWKKLPVSQDLHYIEAGQGS